MNKTMDKYYIAREKSGILGIWFCKPFKEEKEWNGFGYLGALPGDRFPSVKWEDDEPTEISISIKK